MDPDAQSTVHEATRKPADDPEVPGDGADPVLAPDAVDAAAAADAAKTGVPAFDALDDTLDKALGSAATSFWGLASAVQAAVPAEAQSAIAGGGARGLAGLSSAARGVAATVQRNAAVVEEALIASAKLGVEKGSEEDRGAEGGESAVNGEGKQKEGDRAVDWDLAAELDGSIGVQPAIIGAGAHDNDVDVNEELVRAAKNIKESVVGKTVGGLFGSLSMWAKGVEDGLDLEDEDEQPVADAPASRFEALVRELELNPDTYCEPAPNPEAFAVWVEKDYNLDKLEKECISLLDRHPSIEELYERVVPRVIDEDTFWMRYFYARHVLNVQEEERRKLLERAAIGTRANEEEETGWDDDDDDEEEESEAADKTGGATGNADTANEGPEESQPPPARKAKDDNSSDSDSTDAGEEAKDGKKGKEGGAGENDSASKGKSDLEAKADGASAGTDKPTDVTEATAKDDTETSAPTANAVTAGGDSSDSDSDWE